MQGSMSGGGVWWGRGFVRMTETAGLISTATPLPILMKTGDHKLFPSFGDERCVKSTLTVSS